LHLFDLELLVFYHLTNRIMITEIPKSNAHGEMTWHAGRYVVLVFLSYEKKKKKRKAKLSGKITLLC
ncbi:MAG: hypothetical protein KAI72_10695, partial [Candidatus Pacebacteria bacterium]|nr:hypothetical protein [Candidatus Paceibacterota bacterium]